MTFKYILTVHRDLRLANYNPRFKIMRELDALMRDPGLKHSAINKANAAAAKISKNPIVTYVTIDLVETMPLGTWRNGKEDRRKKKATK